MKERAGPKQERHQQERDWSESDERTGICTRCPWLRLVTVGNTIVPFKAFQMTPIASTVYTVQNQELIIEETPGVFNQNRVCGSLVRGGKKAENTPEKWPYLIPVNKNHTLGQLFTPLQEYSHQSSLDQVKLYSCFTCGCNNDAPDPLSESLLSKHLPPAA